MEKKTKRRIWIPILSVFLALILIVVGYAIYLFASYHRLEDNITIEVVGS